MATPTLAKSVSNIIVLHSYTGCMNIYLDGSYNTQNFLSASEEGIYTCRMPDSAGRNIDVSVGIYSYYRSTCKFLLLYIQILLMLTFQLWLFFTTLIMSHCIYFPNSVSWLLYKSSPYTAGPKVTGLESTRSTSDLTLTCTSTTSPATNVTWMKDGDTLDIDGVKYKTYQTVTNRRTSTYQNSLVVDGDIENITGTYTCRVTNRFGSSIGELTVRGTLLGNWLNATTLLVCHFF